MTDCLPVVKGSFVIQKRMKRCSEEQKPTNECMTELWQSETKATSSLVGWRIHPGNWKK
jgi:hypothetical protein